MKVEIYVKKVPAVLIGLLWISLSLNFFLLPHNIASGGVGAIGFLVEMIFSVDRHLIVTVVNFTMLALAFLFLGRQTFAKTLLGSLLFPVYLRFLPEYQLLSSYTLSLLVGSCLFSFGIYSLYRVGASNGGVTVPPLLFEKYFRMDKAIGIFVTNLIIIVLNFVALGIRKAVIAALSIGLISLFMKVMVMYAQRRNKEIPENVEKKIIKKAV
ncbi:hypothetical protein D920_02066 [Enterococcus faecalis 13-SD-W-01]|nr:hypothetical protein D920_02066 [Enterococcus faecalis 13-SD-W-01]